MKNFFFNIDIDFTQFIFSKPIWIVSYRLSSARELTVLYPLIRGYKYKHDNDYVHDQDQDHDYVYDLNYNYVNVDDSNHDIFRDYDFDFRSLSMLLSNLISTFHGLHNYKLPFSCLF